jgi:hypothetical protein
MAQTQYSPMHGPQKLVSQEDMWKKLEKHSGARPLVKPPEATQSPKEKSDPLQWHPPVRTHEGGAGYMASQCGRFSISKDGHKTTGFTYTAWKVLPDDPAGRKVMPVNLGCVRNLADAKTLCCLERDRA